MGSGTQVARAPLAVLLVGTKEEDFFLLRDILERNRNMRPAELDHACSLDEAQSMLEQKPYGLVLFEHETGDAKAVQLLSEFHHAGRSVPFILLTENVDEGTVAELIRSGNWNCVAKSQLDGATLVRSIRGALAMHCMQEERRSAEDSLRKRRARSSNPPTPW